jgi:4'-phosphopantetheinyl transferase
MTELRINWPLPPEEWSSEVKGVEVWAVALCQPEEQLTRLAATLSDDEQARAERFRFDQHRNRFVAGRGLLRAILGFYLGRNPRELEFVYSARGKPSLVHSDDQSAPHFNMAHSGDLALVAVAGTGDVGVDVERVRPLSEAEDIVSRFFSPRESDGFKAVPEAERSRAFFNLWTRKEAWLKATAEGIGQSLNQVEVSFLAGESARFISLFGSIEAAEQWRLWELVPAPGYVGAVATRAKDAAVNCWSWPK